MTPSDAAVSHLREPADVVDRSRLSSLYVSNDARCNNGPQHNGNIENSNNQTNISTVITIQHHYYDSSKHSPIQPHEPVQPPEGSSEQYKTLQEQCKSLQRKYEALQQRCETHRRLLIVVLRVGKNINRTPKHSKPLLIWMLTKFMRHSYIKLRPSLSVSLAWCAGSILTHLSCWILFRSLYSGTSLG